MYCSACKMAFTSIQEHILTRKHELLAKKAFHQQLNTPHNNVLPILSNFRLSIIGNGAGVIGNQELLDHERVHLYPVIYD